MPLLPPEEKILFESYDGLQDFLVEEKKPSWLTNKGAIIKFCIANGIHLYNIGSLKESEAIVLLTELHDHFLIPLELLEKDSQQQWEDLVLLWKQKFEKALENTKANLINLHENAHLSVADQYQKTQKVLSTTLLTFKDMEDLFAYPLSANNILAFNPPFSLQEHSNEEGKSLAHWVRENASENIMLFVPINHDGHWFYLLRQEGKWYVKDSQPLKNDSYSIRQESIVKGCNDLLKKITAAENFAVIFESTGEQDNDYDCGTRVINAYRTLANPAYLEKNHKDILGELLLKQMKEAVFPENMEEIFKPDSFDDNSSDGENSQDNDVFYSPCDTSEGEEEEADDTSEKGTQGDIFYDAPPFPEIQEVSEEEPREFVPKRLDSINHVLTELAEKIKNIDYQHTAAQKTANALLKKLEKYRDDYSKASSEEEEVAYNSFKPLCEQAIKDAEPVLSKDIGWGVYLQNLLKELIHSAVKIVSLGRYSPNFFTIKEAKSMIAIKEARDALLGDTSSTQPSIEEEEFDSGSPLLEK
jgi:hypothetical protein